MCSSLAVRTRWLGTESSYSISHHHWCPVILTLSTLDACTDSIDRPAQILAMSSMISVATVSATATPTLRVSVRSDVVGVFPDGFRRTLRTTAAAMNAMTITNT